MNVYVCFICGSTKTENQNWFLLAENRWQDQLKILRWHDESAKYDFIFHACSPDHVRDFLYAWVTSNRLPSLNKTAFCSSSEGTSGNVHNVGNLWIHRHSLKDTPEGLKSLLDEVICSLKNDSELHEDQLPPKIGPQKISFQAIAAGAS